MKLLKSLLLDTPIPKRMQTSVSSPASAQSCLSQTADQTQWFNQEVAPHGAQLRSYLRKSFPSVRDLDDVVQESFLRIWKARARQSICSAKAFLFQIGRNVATDVIRRERIVAPVSEWDPTVATVASEEPGTVEVLCSREELSLLADAIADLPSRCREIVILRKIERMPQKEIALRLGISENTVQNQTARGVRHCEAYLAAFGVRSR